MDLQCILAMPETKHVCERRLRSSDHRRCRCKMQQCDRLQLWLDMFEPRWRLQQRAVQLGVSDLYVCDESWETDLNLQMHWMDLRCLDAMSEAEHLRKRQLRGSLKDAHNVIWPTWTNFSRPGLLYRGTLYEWTWSFWKIAEMGRHGRAGIVVLLAIVCRLLCH